MWRNFFSVAALLAAAVTLAAGCPAERPAPQPSQDEPNPKSAAPVEPAVEQPAIAEPPVAVEPTTPPATPDPIVEPPAPSEPLPVAEPTPQPAPEISVAQHNPAPPEVAPAKPPEAEPAAPDAAHARPDKHVPKDPVQVNGPIFENWPKPQVALLISGEQIGFMEPCGCAGLTNQKGGLKRRQTLVEQLQAEGWPVVPLDLGGQVKRFGRQAEIKFARTINALSDIGYEAVAFGPQELRLPAEHLLSVAANLAEGKVGRKPLVSANVGILDFDLGYVERFRIIEAGGRKIGVTSVLGKKYQAMINNDDILFVDPEKALAEVVGPMAEKADFLVLLSHATPEESIELAKKFPQFNVVVTAGGAEEPPREAQTIPGTKTRLIEVGHKGMYVAVLGLYDDPQTPVRYQRVPLDHRFKDAPAMQQVLVDYQKELETLGLSGLEVKPQSHATGNSFVGSQTCGECHTKAYEIWSKTPHAHATQSLVDLKPARHFDPECLSCHVTGWDPQNYIPYASGYVDLQKSALLRDNGCENCHGPGSAHAAAEAGDIEATDAQKTEFREQMRLKLVAGEAEGKVVGAVAAKCMECHDLDNSPDFKFHTYWPEVEHKGLD